MKNEINDNLTEIEEAEKLEEAFSMSVSQRSREAKINAALAAICVSIAKQKNDPVVHKMLKYRKLWKESKDQIVQKYRPLAYQKWVQSQAKK